MVKAFLRWFRRQIIWPMMNVFVVSLSSRQWQNEATAQTGLRVAAGLASVYARRHLLEKTVRSLVAQVDEVHVYLNDYPKSYRAGDLGPKVWLHRGPNYGDLGKFAALKHSSADIFFTCDDDLTYHPNYVAACLTELLRRERNTMISLHGSIVRDTSRSYFDRKSRRLFPFAKPLLLARRVDIVGTGCLVSWSSGIRAFDFKTAVPNTADLSFSSWAAASGFRLMLRAHRSDEIVDLGAVSSISASSSTRDSTFMDTSERTNEIFSGLDWSALAKLQGSKTRN